MPFEVLLVLKSSIAHLTNQRFDPFDLVKFHVALQIFLEGETFPTFFAGKFLLSVLVLNDHVDGTCCFFAEHFFTEATPMNGDVFVKMNHVTLKASFVGG